MSILPRQLTPKRLVLMVAVAAVTILTLLMQPTSAAFSARVNATSNTAGTATYFRCTDAYAPTAGSAVFIYGLNEPSGATFAADSSGRNSRGNYQGSMTSAADTACKRDGLSSYVLNGTSSYVSNPTQRTPTNVFTVEIWFKTTVAGGTLIGYGGSATGASSSMDRHIYINTSGRLVFGVYPGSVKAITSPAAYTDGKWHHTAATLSPAGMRLYVDGSLVASDPTVTTAENLNGYWRVGYTGQTGWPAFNTAKPYFTGQLAIAAVYSTALTEQQLDSHYDAGK